MTDFDDLFHKKNEFEVKEETPWVNSQAMRLYEWKLLSL